MNGSIVMTTNDNMVFFSSTRNLERNPSKREGDRIKLSASL